MKYAKVGGQAVIEGVMMRCGDDYAVAVRKPNQEIEVKKDKYEGAVSKLHARRIPVLRGVCAFIDSLVLGMQTLTYSAGFYEDEEDTSEPSAFEKKLDAMLGEKAEKVVMGLTVAFSIVMSVGIFMILPFLISGLFGKVIHSGIALSIIEGIIRVSIFLLYIVLISKMKDIQRVFMYHGAEHKTINCIEAGVELTAENAATYSRLHKRCGTSFMFIVMIISIIFFIFIRIDSFAWKLFFRLLLVPVIAGVSYEIIQWAGRSESKLVCIISKPGMWLQKLTTREPDKEMLEVAIASVEAIYDWRAFQKEAGHAEL